MESVWQILLVFLLSTFKFVFGAVPLALALGFSFFKTVTITCTGGFIGVSFFVFNSHKFIAYLKKRNARKRIENKDQIRKKIFTRSNKTIVKVKQRFGLLGIAILTPPLFSIPIGCLIAVRYYKDRQQILKYMFASILFWSVSISALKLLF